MTNSPCCVWLSDFVFFFFFNDTATTEIYTLSLHDALPIWRPPAGPPNCSPNSGSPTPAARSEEHTSELQSRPHLVCRLLLEKKKQNPTTRSAIEKTNPYDDPQPRSQDD